MTGPNPGGRRPIRVPLQQLDPGLPLPAHAHPGDAGVDLVAAESVTIGPGERVTVPTGVAVAIPDDFAGLVTPRSGLAHRHGLGVVNAPGVVDSGYRGEIRVILINHGTESVSIARGDRIAQLLVVPVAAVAFELVTDLTPSERGADGFGSTGR